MTTLLPLLALLTAASPARAQDEGTWSPRVTAVSGDVLIFSKGSEEGLPAEEGTPVEEGDRVETGDDGRAEIALEPDSVMDLGPRTSFTVGSIQRGNSWFSLDLGSFVAKLKSFAGSRDRLQVRTPTAVAAVRGTEFGVDVAEEGRTDVGVFDEGAVAVRGAQEEGGAETMLTAQKEMRAEEGQALGAPHPLERLKARQDVLQRLRARRAELKKAWKSFSPAQRLQARQAWRARVAARMKAMPKQRRQRLLQALRQRRERLQARQKALEQQRQKRRQQLRRAIERRTWDRRRRRASQQQKRKAAKKRRPAPKRP